MSAISSPQRSERKKPNRDEWAMIWFRKLAMFRGQSSSQDWEFTVDDVIAFLRSERDRGTPIGKRLKIVEAPIRYRNLHYGRMQPFLEPVRGKLQELRHREKFREALRQAEVKKYATSHILASLICNASSSVRHRHSHDPGTAGAQGCFHHDDQYSRAFRRQSGGSQPVGSLGKRSFEER